MKKLLLFISLTLITYAVKAQINLIGDTGLITTCNVIFFDAGGETGYAGYEVKTSSFKSADGTCLMANFEQFDLGFGAVLKIYKGENTSSGILIGSYSGTNIPPSISAPALTFEYIPSSFNIGNLPGWKANIKCYECSIDQIKSDPASDCTGAIPLCSNNTVIVSVNQYNDTGADDDDTGNCFSGTGNGGSVWYTFQPQATGQLDFSIAPDGSTDYDYVLYDATAGCNNLDELSCNFSGTYGTTGLTTNSSDYQNSYSSCSGGSNYYSAPASCGVWNQAVNVNAANTYVLMVNFYGGSNDGFTLHFQNDPSTVAITDNIPPTFENVTQPTCNGSKITVHFSENINCTTLQASDFSIPGYTISIANSNCVSNMTQEVVLNVSPVLPPGNYTLQGQTMSDMCGNNLNDTYNFTIANAAVTVTVNGNNFCSGNTTLLTTTTSGFGLSYNWSTGSTASSITVSTGGNYCVTVSDACSQTANDCISITMNPSPVINATYSCTGGGTGANLSMTGCTGTPKWYRWDKVCDSTCIGFINPFTGDCVGSWLVLCDSNWVQIATNANTSVTAPFASQYMAECTSANSCQTQQIVDVVCSSVLTVSVNSATICSGACTNITATVSGGTAPYTYAWSVAGLSGPGPHNVCPTTTTTYTVTVTDNAGTIKTASGTITVNPTPTVNAGNDVNICSGNNTTLTATGANSYTWSNGLGAGASQTVSPASTTTYYVTGTNTFSCTGSDFVTVSVVNGTPLVITGQTALCGTTNASLNAGAGYTSYSWSTGATTQSITVIAAGTYYVTVTSSAGCTASGFVNVNATTPVTSSITNHTDVSCFGANDGTATATASGGTGPYTYLWGPGNLTGATVNGLAAGTYEVTVTDANGCTSTSSTPPASCFEIESILIDACIPSGNEGYQEMVFFQVGPNSLNTANLNVTWASANTWLGVCTDPTFVANVNATITGGGMLIEPPGGVIPAGAQVVLITSTAENVTYNSFVNLSYPLYAVFQCGSTTAGHFGNYQATSSIRTLSLNFGGACSDVVTYDRSLLVNQSGAAGAQDGASVTYTAGGTATYSNNGCVAPFVTSNNSVIIDEPTELTINLTGVNIPCSGGTTGSATVHATGGTPNYIYAWSNNTTTPATSATSHSISGINAGPYYVTVSDSKGCTKSSFVNITQAQMFTMSGTVTNVICNGASTGGVTLNLSGETQPVNFNWSNGTSNQDLSNVIAGNYFVTVSDGAGCTTNTSFVITQGAAMSVTISGTTTFCSGNTSTLDAGAGFANYSWSSGQNTQTITVSSTGTYSVTVSNVSNCTASNSATVTVNPLPVPTAGNNSPLCAGSTLNLTSGGGATYSWSGPGGYTSNLEDPSILNATTAESGQYSVTVTSANGCTATATTSATINAMPVATANNDGPVCAGAALTLSSGGGLTYLWSGPNGFNSNIANPTINPTTTAMSGTYFVTVSTGSCSGSASTIVTINPIPAPTINSNSPICAGATLSLSSSGGTTYSWAGPNGFTSTQQNSSILNSTTAATGFYTVTATSNGCSTSTSISVTVKPIPVANANNNSPICAGSTLNLNASGGASYSWSGPNGFSSAFQTQALSNTNASMSGTYTVTVTLNGCSSTANTSVTINPMPVPSAANNGPICAGTNLNLSSSGGDTYQWSGPLSYTSNTQNPVINNASSLATGTYTVTVSFAATGCSQTKTTNAVVNPIPYATVNANSIVCEGQTVNITSTGGASYSWNGPNSYTSSSQNPVLQNVTVNSSGTYIVTVTTAGCSDTAAINITINPLPVVAINANSPLCVGSTLNLTSSGGAYYQWSGPDGFVSVNQNPVIGNITPNASGTYTVTVTSSANCYKTSTINILVNQNPTPTITGINNFCTGSSVSLDAGSGYATYLWSNGSSTQVLTASQGGSYYVTVTETTGCTGTASFTVTENANPSPAITGSLSICEDETTNLDAGNGFTTYVWSTGELGRIITTGAPGSYSVTVTDFNGCNGTATADVTVNQKPVPVISSSSPLTFCEGGSAVLNAGTYDSYNWSTGAISQTITVSTSNTYSVTVANSFGCTESTSIKIVVIPTVDVEIDLSLSPPDTICPNTQMRVNGFATNPGSTPKYYWFLNNAVVDSNVTHYDNDSLQNGDYVKCVLISSMQCADNPAIDSVKINVWESPQINVSADVLSGCVPHKINFIESTPCAGCTYIWGFGEGGLSTAKNPEYIYNKSGTFDVSITIRSPHGCESDTIFEEFISVYPNPEARFKAVPEVTTIFNPVIEFDNLSIGAETYNWLFGDGFISPESDPWHGYTKPGIYPVTLIAYSEFLCTDTIIGTVRIDDEVAFWAPSAFTPEKDGFNDNFYISGRGISSDKFFLAVYDRWGAILFETKNFDPALSISGVWDGKTKTGTRVKQGTYTWYCSYKDPQGMMHEKAGHVTIVR